MSFLSGLGQFAANAVVPTLNVAAARAQAQRAEEDSQRQQMIQAVLLQKQLEQARIDNALKAQQTATSAAHGSLYTQQAGQPKPPVLGTPEYLKAETDLEKMRAANRPPTAPLLGSPEYLAAQTGLAKMRQQYAPAFPQTIQVLPGANGLPSQGVVTSTRDASQLGKSFAIPDVNKTVGGATNAPLAARESQFGMALKAAASLVPIHNQLAVSGIPAGAQEAAKTAHGEGWFSKIPFGQEIGNRALNASPDYASYEATLPNLIIGSAHSMGGARISLQQIQQIANADKLAPGDQNNPTVGARKLQNAMDFLNSARASLSPEAVAKQEADLTPGQLQILRQAGYGGQPTGHAISALRGVDPQFQVAQPEPAAGGTSAVVAKPAKPGGGKFDPDAFYKQHMTRTP